MDVVSSDPGEGTDPSVGDERSAVSEGTDAVSDSSVLVRDLREIEQKYAPRTRDEILFLLAMNARDNGYWNINLREVDREDLIELLAIET